MKPFLADPEKQRVAEDITYKEDIMKILKADNEYEAVKPLVLKILTKKTGGKRTRRRKRKKKKRTKKKRRRSKKTKRKTKRKYIFARKYRQKGCSRKRR